MILGRVETVFVEDERVGGGADLQQSMPVDVVSGKARYLEAEHDTGMAEADLGHQMAETPPGRQCRIRRGRNR